METAKRLINDNMVEMIMVGKLHDCLLCCN